LLPAFLPPCAATIREGNWRNPFPHTAKESLGKEAADAVGCIFVRNPMRWQELPFLFMPSSVKRRKRCWLASYDLNFMKGSPNTAPPGWLLAPEWFMPPHTPVYEAKTVSGAPCNGSQQCATVYSLRDDPHVRLCFLYPVVDATQFRNDVSSRRTHAHCSRERRAIARSNSPN
jgi:hypothetical protein